MSDIKEKVASVVFLISALASVLAVLLICFFLFLGGVPAIVEIGFTNFIFGEEWSPTDEPPLFGVFPMIVGSLYVTAGAIVIGVPIGTLTAAFLARICPRKPYKIVKPVVRLLAGIPSIVYGFFAMIILIPITGASILSASIMLGVMILPTVIEISESAIRAVPDSYYEGALALGAGRYRAIFFVLLPAARSGVLAAIALGIGRAIGETMAVIMVAGNQARTPDSIFDGVRTLTANIVIEMGYAADLHREALIATGVVLFVFILIINLSVSALANRSFR
ncbi:MAG: phosphate ABC transporter permease subunit PstC [Helicobacteraceae bacterium]|nr:phosphate ABC transporter permease subunit PstC [Helicobacteraceae bacterium]